MTAHTRNLMEHGREIPGSRNKSNRFVDFRLGVRSVCPRVGMFEL